MGMTICTVSFQPSDQTDYFYEQITLKATRLNYTILNSRNIDNVIIPKYEKYLVIGARPSLLCGKPDFIDLICELDEFFLAYSIRYNINVQ